MFTIEAKIQALSEATGTLAQKMYAEQSDNADAGSGSFSDGAQARDEGGAEDDAVDAEFEEVKDDDQSKST